MNRTAWKTLLCCAFLSTLLGTAVAVAAPHDGSDAAELAQYGSVTNVSIVTNGFVFVGNAYLDSPYRVTQEGLCIYINDELMDRVSVLSCVPSVTSPPPVPASIATNTSIFSDEVCGYSQQVTFYRIQNFSLEEGYAKEIALMRLLPCISRIDYNPTTTRCTLHSWRGEELTGLLRPAGRKGIQSRKDALAALGRTRSYFEQALAEGQVIIVAKGGGTRMQIPPMAVKRELPAILMLRNRNIASTPVDGRPQAQAQALARVGLRIDPRLFPDLLTNLTASAQLEERITLLIDK
jgi:hypothetical protein